MVLQEQVVVGLPPMSFVDGSDLRSDARVRAWACGPGFTESDASTVQMVLSSDVPVVLECGGFAIVGYRYRVEVRVPSPSGARVHHRHHPAQW